MALKHVGRMIKSKRKVIVAYRVVPNEPDNAIVITTENLSADEHDTLMRVVESDAGQSENELSNLLARTRLPDGRIALAVFHTQGKMVKVKQSEVEMTPTGSVTLPLDELNRMIAEQQGVTVADLALKGPDGESVPVEEAIDPVASYIADTPAETVENEVLTDEVLAAQYRSQADAMFKEAKRLREQAEELVPTKRKNKKTEESV